MEEGWREYFKRDRLKREEEHPKRKPKEEASAASRDLAGDFLGVHFKVGRRTPIGVGEVEDLLTQFYLWRADKEKDIKMDPDASVAYRKAIGGLNLTHVQEKAQHDLFTLEINSRAAYQEGRGYEYEGQHRYLSKRFGVVNQAIAAEKNELAGILSDVDAFFNPPMQAEGKNPQGK